ncbi:MAG: PAS domain S-box protein, partial [Ramlibacter sp.]|nr:PAS domain S-box protein [Ramlibacter sp.]
MLSPAGSAPEQDAANAAPRRRIFGGLRALPLAALAFAAGLGATLLVWQRANEIAREGTAQRFEYRTGRILAELQRQLGADELLLRSVAGLFRASGGAGRAQWRTYFDAMEPGNRSPDRLWVAYAQRVPGAELEAHESQARADGLAGYSVRATQRRNQYFPIAYFRSFGNQDRRPIGLDLQADPAAAAAMSRAAESGASVLAGPLGLPDAAAQDQPVWALFAPVYAGLQPQGNPAQRQTALTGYVIEAFDAAEMTRNALGPDFTIIGMNVRDGAVPVYTGLELKKALAGGYRPTLAKRVDFEFGQRRWDVEFVALPKFHSTASPNESWAILAGGLVISALLAGLVGLLASQRARAMALVEQRTGALRGALAQHADSEARLRAVFDHALDGIITIDSQGSVQSFNPAAERIFGWSRDEVLGRNLSLLMPQPDQGRHDAYIQSYLAEGTPRIIGIGRLVTGLRKDGSLVPLDLAISEMQVGHQRLFCGILRDVSDRLESERAVREGERKLRSYIEQTLDGFMVVDREGRYLEVNPAAAKMLG